MVCVSPVRCGTGCVWCRTGYVLPVRCGTGCILSVRCRMVCVLPVRCGTGCVWCRTGYGIGIELQYLQHSFESVGRGVFDL